VIPIRTLPRLAPLLVALVASAAPAPAPPALDGALRQLDRAAISGSAEALRAVRADLAGIVADAPGAPAAQVALALADWRLVPLLGKEQADLGRKLCAEGIAACDRAATADPRSARAVALKAALQGLSLGFVPGAAMSLGPEIVEGTARARGLAPDDPMVLVLAGITTMHMPEFAGGGAGKARALFEHAVASADSSRDGRTWGRVEASLWLGRCLESLGDTPGAIAWYERVLATEPDHAWVSRVLLPSARRRAAADTLR
jgi:hypothetical protein